MAALSFWSIWVKEAGMILNLALDPEQSARIRRSRSPGSSMMASITRETSFLRMISGRSSMVPRTRLPPRVVPCLRGESSTKPMTRSFFSGERRTSRSSRSPALPAPTMMAFSRPSSSRSPRKLAVKRGE